jgi:glycogen debranching enzyme
MVEAAMHFEHYRLPELFSGFARQEYDVPVRYPVACHPQAWAAGTVPYMLETALGLMPEADAQRLRIVRPVLPGFIRSLDVRRLRVGCGSADLRFTRTTNDTVSATVLHSEGSLEIVTESE